MKYNYSIYPKNDKYCVEIYSNQSKVKYDVERYIQAVRVVQIVGLELRKEDRELMAGINAEIDWSFLGQLVYSVEELDSEMTVTTKIDVKESA